MKAPIIKVRELKQQNNRDAENDFTKLYLSGYNLEISHCNIQQIWLTCHLKEFNVRTKRKR